MAENKVSTLDQLKKAAIRGKMHSDAAISELAALVAAGLEDVQHSGITVNGPQRNILLQLIVAHLVQSLDLSNGIGPHLLKLLQQFAVNASGRKRLQNMLRFASS